MDDKKVLFATLIAEVKDTIRKPIDHYQKLQDICDLLKEQVSYYDWVGFYLVDPQRKKALVLGPFAGEPTEHIRIPFGKGICGQAAETKATFLVQDVSKATSYLSCSPSVKSEIVIPIFKNGIVIGELDIDSHQLSPFTDDDNQFLEDICALIADQLYSLKIGL